MKKQIKKIMVEFCEMRKNWEGCLQLDKTYLNICYYLISKYFVKCNDLDDFMNLYDNLTINNEIIDKYNVNEYEKETIEKICNLKYSTILKRLNNNKILLLNYYNDNNLISCRIWLDLEYNILDNDILSYLK